MDIVDSGLIPESLTVKTTGGTRGQAIASADEIAQDYFATYGLQHPDRVLKRYISAKSPRVGASFWRVSIDYVVDPRPGDAT